MYYIPADETEVPAQKQQTRITHMTPELFAQRFLVVEWMRAKWRLAKELNTMLEVEVVYSPAGKHVLALNVVNGAEI